MRLPNTYVCNVHVLRVVLEAEYYLMTVMHQNYVSTIEIEQLILLGIPALTQICDLLLNEYNVDNNIQNHLMKEKSYMDQ